MGRIFSEICYILIVLFLSGCVLDSDSKKTVDKGSYTLESNKSEIQSYPGGGGLFILIMKPSEDFGGDVRLSIDTNPVLNVKLTNNTLSIGRYLSEVEIYPDSILGIGSFSLNVISKHGGISNSLELFVEVIEPYPPIKPTHTPPQSFVTWLDEEYPEMGISPGQEWFHYRNNPIMLEPGNSVEQTWLNQSWEMTVFNLGYPPFIRWFLLRKRGFIEPLLCVRKDDQGLFEEIPVNDFGK